MTSCMLATYFAYSQVQNDSILFERNIQEVIISATKTSKSIDELPIPVTIISEKEIQAIRDFALEKNFVLSIAYHSSRSGCVSERVIYSWGWKDKNYG